MDYINNFSAVLTDALSESGQSLPVAADDLARVGSGSFTLTIAPALNIDTADREIITISDSVLSRGQEGTIAKSWPVGSVVYAAVTAGQLTDASDAVSDLVDRIGSEMGVYPEPYYPYSIATVNNSYYSPSNRQALGEIRSIKNGVVVLRDEANSFYNEPLSVLILSAQGRHVSGWRNPTGVNWSQYGVPRHGLLGFSGYGSDKSSFRLVHENNGPANPPVKISQGIDGWVSEEMLPDDTGSLDAVSKITSGKLILENGREIQLSRNISNRNNKVFTGNDGFYYTHDMESERLVKINNVGSVTDVAVSPKNMVYAQGADGNLIGMHFPYDRSVRQVGIFDTGNGSYRDISDQINTAEIVSTITQKESTRSFAIMQTEVPERNAIAEYSSGVYYFAAFNGDSHVVIAITKK